MTRKDQPPIIKQGLWDYRRGGCALRGYDRVHLKIGSHVVFLIQSKDQWERTLIPLLKAALQHREICAVFSAANHASLKKLGKDVRLYTLRKGSLGSTRELASLLRHLVLEAHRNKRQGVRALVDMTWYLKNDTLANVLKFEREMDELLASQELPLTLVCAYDLGQIRGTLTMDVLDLHPQVICRDVEEEPPFFVRIATRLFRDPLTGLYNSRYLHERLEEELDRGQRYGGKFCVLVTDVDSFQSVNDAYGYIRGDKVLVDLARLLRKTVRKVDLVCRYGDDEFILLLPETSKRGGLVISGRLREAATGIRLKGGPLSLKIGIATFPEDGKAPDLLIKKAVSSLRRLKNSAAHKG